MSRSRFFLVFSLALLGSPAWAQAPSAATETGVAAAESAYWRAYNECDVEAVKRLLTNDTEFYHDSIGLTTGAIEVSNLVKNNICGHPDHRIRRVELGAPRVSLLRKKGSVYGALVTGEHQFYVRDKGNPEYPSSRARYVSLWTLSGEEWKMARVISYEHGPVPYQNQRKKISLSQKELKQFVGDYVANDGSHFLVKDNKDHLELNAAGKVFSIYPFEKTGFFLADEDTTFSFALGAKGEASAITVREHGAVVDEAKRATSN